MCDSCAMLAEAGPLRFRRALTPHEATHGELERVLTDFDEAELEVAELAAPVAKKMRDQLLAEVAPLIASGDVAGLATLRASHAGELAAALRKGAAKAYKRGLTHIREQRDKALGTTLAEKPRTPENAKKYLDDAAAVYAENVADQMAASVRKRAHATIVKGGEEIDQTGLDAITKEVDGLLVKASVSIGREAMGMGRQEGYVEDTTGIASLMYSAVLDNNTCGECESMDGEIYTAEEGTIEDGLLATPNPDCEGMAHGHVCRCVMIAEYRRA